MRANGLNVSLFEMYMEEQLIISEYHLPERSLKQYYPSLFVTQLLKRTSFSAKAHTQIRVLSAELNFACLESYGNAN